MQSKTNSQKSSVTSNSVNGSKTKLDGRKVEDVGEVDWAQISLVTEADSEQSTRDDILPALKLIDSAFTNR